MGGEKIGPYRIEKRLGAGGMGEVFKAHDGRLDRWVAIKRIRPDKQDAEDNRERLSREARAVAKLNHSSIVQIYDIFKDGESDCIVMEYIEGNSLDRMISDGPLDPPRALRLGYGIAMGLAQAHAKGIIHRDLKAENVIVTPEDQPKILDFGLAKPIAHDGLDPSLTGKGQLVGTSRAMSPEYVGGGEVDHRSDLFSLGVLLYEVVVGESPFKGQNTLATLKQVILHRQVPAAEVNPAVPLELSDLIDRLLAKEPEERPQTANEVAQEIREILGRITSGDIELPSSGTQQQYLTSGSTDHPSSRGATTTATAIHPPRRRIWWSLAALLALAAASYVVMTRSGLWREAPFRFQADDRIVIGNFENNTDDSMLNSLDIAFRVSLEQSSFASVLSESEIRAVLERMQRQPDTLIDRELGIEICQREGAKALVIGGIVQIGTAYSLSAEIIDPQTGSSVFTVPATTVENQDAILSVLEKITRDIRANLGESLAMIQQTTRPLQRVTTPNLKALEAYSLGIEKMAAGQYEASIPLFERALGLDPEFAMAHAKLGTLYFNRDRNAQAWHHYQEALKLADRLPDFERLYIEGWIATWRGTPEEMIQAWSLLSNLYPQEFEGHNNLGTVYLLFRNEYEEAAQAFETAARLADSSSRPLASARLGYSQLALNRFQEAVASFETAWDLSRSYDSIGLAEAYIAMRRYSDARVFLEESLDSPSRETQLEARLRLALYYADQGRFREALTEIRQVEDQALSEGMKRREISSQIAIVAFLEQGRERRDFARALDQAIATSQEVLTSNHELGFSPVPVLALLGKISARNGMIDKAGEIQRQIAPLAEKSGFGLLTGYAAILDGEIHAGQGRKEMAIKSLQNAIRPVEIFQAHESLARIYESDGDLEAAISEYRWIVDHRGRAFAECIDVCYTRASNIIDWAHALYRLGQLYQEQKQDEEAVGYYEKFLDQWREGDPMPAKQEAILRLEALRRSISPPSREKSPS